MMCYFRKPVSQVGFIQHSTFHLENDTIRTVAGDDALPVSPIRALMFIMISVSVTSSMLAASCSTLLLQETAEASYHTLVVSSGPQTSQSHAHSKRVHEFIDRQYANIVMMYLLLSVLEALSCFASIASCPFPALSAFLLFPILSFVGMALLAFFRSNSSSIFTIGKSNNGRVAADSRVLFFNIIWASIYSKYIGSPCGNLCRCKRPCLIYSRMFTQGRSYRLEVVA